jgi:hypothetical protein
LYFYGIFSSTSVVTVRGNTLAESSSLPQDRNDPVRLVVKSGFDDIELFSRPFPSKEAAEEFMASNPDSGVTYEFDGDPIDS